MASPWQGGRPGAQEAQHSGSGDEGIRNRNGSFVQHFNPGSNLGFRSGNQGRGRGSAGGGFGGRGQGFNQRRNDGGAWRPYAQRNQWQHTHSSSDQVQYANNGGRQQAASHSQLQQVAPPNSTGLQSSGSSHGDKLDGDAILTVDREVLEEKKGKKPYCFRCLTKGHINSVCTAVLDCAECGSDEHATKACASFKHTRITAITSGYAVDGLGFYYIPYLGKQQFSNDSPAAMVKVTDGSLTAANVTAELQRLVPVPWEWKVDTSGENAFVTTFPSKLELQRLVEWGPVVTKSVKAIMTIEESPGTDVFRYEIPKVWVQFRGFPDDLRKFSFLWAVGSTIGATRMVDMKFTNAHGIARVKVACLNPELIPEFISIVLGDYVYELQFRVEENLDQDNPLPINMDIDDDSHGMGDDNLEPNNDSQNLKEHEKAPSAPAAPAANQINKVSKQNLISPSGDNPVVLAAAVNQHAGEGNAASVNLSPECALSPPKSGKKLASAPPRMISHAPVLPSRSSKRAAATADQNSLERASKLKAKINLDSSMEKGSIQGNSLASVLGQVAAK